MEGNKEEGWREIKKKGGGKGLRKQGKIYSKINSPILFICVLITGLVDESVEASCSSLLLNKSQ